jgi:thiamine biosynthesis lipoprotein
METTRDWELWSTRCRIVVIDPAKLSAAGHLADAVLADVERACSRFRGDSEMLMLTEGWNNLSPTLADLMREALVAAWLSDGAVDPTIGAALTGLGYDRDIEEVRTSPAGKGRVRLVRAAPGWRSLRLDGTRLYRPAGVQLDLGATAKAVAADRTAARIADALDTGVLVSLGGDIATAGPAPEGGWQVTVQDLPTDAPQQVTLTAGAAVATSSTARRTWEYDGRLMHHVIDPTTGLPTTGPWRAVTVVAEDCSRANAATTGSLVKGHDAVAWLRGLGLPARLVDHAGAVRTLNDFPREVAA